MHALVSRWTRDVDVFAKRLLLVPISDKDGHWTLAVVCHPGELLDYAGHWSHADRDDEALRPCLVGVGA